MPRTAARGSSTIRRTEESRPRRRRRGSARRLVPRPGGERGHGPADGPEDRSLYDRCISRGLPGSMMPAIYGSSYQIVQGPG